MSPPPSPPPTVSASARAGGRCIISTRCGRLRGGCASRAPGWRDAAPIHPLCGHHHLLLLAQAGDAEADRVARLEEARRLLAGADARRRAGGDHVAGLERHEAADIAHQEQRPENHRAGRAALHALAIDVEVHLEALHVVDLVGGHQIGPQRPEGRATLALHPLAGALELVGPFRDVMTDGVAGDVRERLLLLDVTAALADDDGELDLPVGLLGIAWDHEDRRSAR